MGIHPEHSLVFWFFFYTQDSTPWAFASEQTVQDSRGRDVGTQQAAPGYMLPATDAEKVPLFMP